MAEVSRPTPDNARLVSIAEYEHISAAYMADGLFPDMTGANIDPNGGLAPVYANGSGMSVFVRAGINGAVRGFGWSSGDTDYSLAIGANATGSARIDRVVLELDRATWNVRTAVVAGTAGFGAPALTRDIGTTGKFQVPLARVTVNSGVSAISAGNVTLESEHVGSNVKAWPTLSSPYVMVMGEIGFDLSTKRWFGFDGTSKTYMTDTLDPDPVHVTNGYTGTVPKASRDTFVETLSNAASGQGGISVGFTAGRKGIALVHVSTLARTSQQWVDIMFGARIRRVSDNAIIFTPSDRECAATDNPFNTTVARTYKVSGLVPGVQYKAVGIHKTTDNFDGYFDDRVITVDPR